jgi:Ca2+-binding RTX toxin-like protein
MKVRFAMGAVVALSMFGFAGSAQGAITLGQTSPDDPSGCADGNSVQEVTEGGASYVVPSTGVITSWTHKAKLTGGRLRLQVWDQVGNPYTLVGVSSLENVVAGQLNTFPTRVPVVTGNVLGLHSDNGVGGCMFNSGTVGDTLKAEGGGQDYPIGGSMFTPSTLPGKRLNVSVQMEPDCDQDGFGDETQDQVLVGVVCSGGKTCAGRVPTIVGSEGNDTIIGTSGKDVILALGGDDKVSGLGDNDFICGTDGKDRLKGGAGRDRLFGGKGKDKLIGGSGKDRLVGGPGKDKTKQ